MNDERGKQTSVSRLRLSRPRGRFSGKATVCNRNSQLFRFRDCTSAGKRHNNPPRVRARNISPAPVSLPYPVVRLRRRIANDTNHFGKDHAYGWPSIRRNRTGSLGHNIALNIERNGYPVAVFNRTYAKSLQFINGVAKGKNFKTAESFADYVKLLECPRRILMLVKAGGPHRRHHRGHQALPRARRHPHRRRQRPLHRHRTP